MPSSLSAILSRSLRVRTLPIVALEEDRDGALL